MQQRMGIAFVVIATLALAVGIGAHVALAQGPKGSPKAAVAALGNGFTYQGQLKKNGNPVSVTCTFTFSLWDSSAGGSLIGSPQAQSLAVTNGLFTSNPIDFGTAAFQGDARYLQITAQCPGDVSATTLSRQALTPAPYALALPGLYTQQNATSPNVIGGYSGNMVDGGVFAATIGGGGESGSINHVSGIAGTIGGGANNTIPPFGSTATIGGGYGNTASGLESTIGGGENNTASGIVATVGGGKGNIASGVGSFTGGGGYDGTHALANMAQGNASVIGGGISNTVSVNGFYATIGGGEWNTASGSDTTIGGGILNTANGESATVAGGVGNAASGYASMVGAGRLNVVAGAYSFAAGNRAKNGDSSHNGVFLFADSNDFDFNSTAANQFRVRSTGGAQFVLAVNGSGNPTWTCSVSNGGSWACSSDRNLKENLIPANSKEMLARVNALPIYNWNAKGVDASIRHLGPTAQDFHSAFGLGNDDKTISTIDLEGVALAAIQGLAQVAREQDAEIGKLKAQSEKQQTEIQDLKTRMTALEQASSVTVRAHGQTFPTTWVLFGGLVVAGWFAVRRQG